MSDCNRVIIIDDNKRDLPFQRVVGRKHPSAAKRISMFHERKRTVTKDLFSITIPNAPCIEYLPSIINQMGPHQRTPK